MRTKKQPDKSLRWVYVPLNCSNNVLFIVKPPLILKLYQKKFCHHSLKIQEDNKYSD